MITFDQVTKTYADGTTAVDNLSMEIPSGKITVLVGPSGCGKTTSLRMINRMIDLSKGHIIVDGKDIATQDEALLRRSIGYVIQQAGLFPHRTVLDNIMTVPNLIGTNKAKSRARALELLGRVGLDPSFAKRYPSQLSGGQAQRVGVARALAADPPIMLMDEPFSAIDPIVRAELQSEFLRLQSEIGKTIVMVTHDIDEAIKLGDKVAILQQGGKLVQFDSPKELLANPRNDFVAEFVGRDRGFRGLSFTGADRVQLRSIATRPSETFELRTDHSGKPIAWLLDDGSEHRIASVDVFTNSDSLRRVIDLAIASPVGVALRVDASGAADGWISFEDLAAQLESSKRDATQ